jgi:hypothetical protein
MTSSGGIFTFTMAESIVCCHIIRYFSQLRIVVSGPSVRICMGIYSVSRHMEVEQRCTR